MILRDESVRMVVAAYGGAAAALAPLQRASDGRHETRRWVALDDAAALDAWLGITVQDAYGEPAARTLAMAAYRQAATLPGDAPCLGIGATVSPEADVLHVAWQSAAVTASVTRPLAPSSGKEAAGMDETLRHVVAAIERGESIDQVRRVDAPASWQQLTGGIVDRVAHVAPAPAAGTRTAIFPGAFAPLHDGHRGMRRVAETLLGTAVAFEISVDNVDKPPLDFIEMYRRAEQFGPGDPLWFTRAATFVAKARLFAPVTFVLGADTVMRIAEPRYYDDVQARDAALAELARLDTRLLVFGRVVGERFCRLDQLDLPEALLRLCDAVEEEDFRHDVSSTHLRQRDGW